MSRVPERVRDVRYPMLRNGFPVAGNNASLDDDRFSFRGHVGIFQGCNDFFESDLFVVVGNGDQPLFSQFIGTDPPDIFQDSPCPRFFPSGIAAGNGQADDPFRGPHRRQRGDRQEKQGKQAAEKTPDTHKLDLSFFLWIRLPRNLSAFHVKSQENFIGKGLSVNLDTPEADCPPINIQEKRPAGGYRLDSGGPFFYKMENKMRNP